MTNPLDTCVFSWLSFNREASLLNRHEGLLFRFAAPLSEKKQSYYKSLRSPGWYKCPDGYAVRVYQLDTDTFFVFPDLKVKGISTVSGKSENLSIKSTPDTFDTYFENILSAYSDSLNEDNIPLEGLVHDIRKMNSDIYNIAIELEALINSEGTPPSSSPSNVKESQLVGNIVAISEIMSGRLDLVGMENVFYMKDTYGNVTIPLYKKIDKTFRSFKFAAKQKKISTKLEGTSHLEIRGPKVFDAAIYAVMDNMIKYAPHRTEVNIHVQEIGQTFKADFTGLGPKLDPEEMSKIFDRNYRAKEAIRSQAVGSGIGLFIARGIIEKLFNGTLTVSQGPALLEINGISFVQTTFSLSIPTASSTNAKSYSSKIGA